MNKILKKLMAVMAAVLLLGCVSAAALTVDADCSIRLTLGDGANDELNATTVTGTLYRVADVSEDYVYTPVEGFETLKDALAGYKDLDTADEQQAVEADVEALLEDAQPESVELAFENSECDVTGLKTGLYLLQVDEIATGAHVYTFTSVLISLPSMTGEINGEWTSESGVDMYTIEDGLEYTVKYEAKERMADLTITKAVTGGVYAGEPATFVFQIEAVMQDEDDETRMKTVYSDVVSIVLTDETYGTATIAGRIPVGATVTVTEVYSGAGYTFVSSSETGSFVMPDAEDGKTPTYTVDFVNERSTTDTPKGSSVTNIFTYDETTESWTLNGVYDDGRTPVTVG